MYRYPAQTSSVLSPLSSLDERKILVPKFSSFVPLSRSSVLRPQNHPVGSFQMSTSILHSLLQDEPEKMPTVVNGCKLRLTNDEYVACSGNALIPPPAGGNPRCCNGSDIARTTSSGESQRPRSQSMGSVVLPQSFRISRSPSRDSLTSHDSLADEYQSLQKSGNAEEVLVEVTCNRFKRLSTRGSDSPKSQSPISQYDEASAASGSPPLETPDIVRKYSIGSQPVSCKRQLSRPDYANNCHARPIDLTCKRKKSDATTSGSLDCLSVQQNGLPLRQDYEESADPEPEENSGEDKSILKSVLVGQARKRSHTLSVCGRQHFRNGSRPAPPFLGFSLRQRVTLAKRTLGPVMGRMSEHLNRIVQLLNSLPEFMRLSSTDQKCLLNDSVHRLLLLYVAEDNLQFVVTPVREEEEASYTEEGTVIEEPTMQFAETVQNFISKCQAMNITSSEYIYMRSMTLFHTGSRMLENSKVVEKANSDAQLNLQGLIQHCHPDDRLRYSKLLLTLYTLFGINCAMVEALFCRRLLPPGGQLQQFIHSEFLANQKHLDD